MRVRMLWVAAVAVALALAFSRPMDAKSPYAPPAEREAAMEASAR